MNYLGSPFPRLKYDKYRSIVNLHLEIKSSYHELFYF